MGELLRRYGLVLFLGIAIAGCSDDDPGLQITGPEVPTGQGRVYPITEVSFAANDGVEVSALFGALSGGQALPVVILLHDLGGDKGDWLSSTSAYVELLERNYAVLAIDMRGHGDTPLPEDRQVLQLADLENSFLDVHAALTWLQSQSGVDPNRVAVIGSGSGANVAYVSLGVFPEQIRTGISLSPGLWEASSLEPLLVGDGIDPFGPRSILFMVGEGDQLQGPDISLSYADFARSLEALTAEPKDLRVFQNSADHGFELLNNVPEALDLLFLWLENNL
jgi:pimeloyl-ACP methyl ester carboxylesterase